MRLAIDTSGVDQALVVLEDRRLLASDDWVRDRADPPVLVRLDAVVRPAGGRPSPAEPPASRPRWRCAMPAGARSTPGGKGRRPAACRWMSLLAGCPPPPGSWSSPPGAWPAGPRAWPISRCPRLKGGGPARPGVFFPLPLSFVLYLQTINTVDG